MDADLRHKEKAISLLIIFENNQTWTWPEAEKQQTPQDPTAEAVAGLVELYYRGNHDPPWASAGATALIYSI